MDADGRPVREIFLSAGEASGDLHASELLHRLKSLLPGSRFTCLGGPALAAAGAEVLVSNGELAVVGLFEVLRHARVIADAFCRIRQHLARARPDLIILVDFPDFNFLLMRMAKRLGIPVFYYISPQVWAWRRGRVRTLKRLADDVVVILPFEAEFFRAHGVEVQYVGHPLLDVMRDRPSREEARQRYRTAPDRFLVGLLPGSRQGEVRRILPILAEAAATIARHRSDVEFIIPLAPSLDPGVVDELLQRWSLPLRRVQGDTYGVIAACDLILTASGTVTLEAALLGTPMIITYRLSDLSYRVGRRFVKIPWVGLPNLIAGKGITPELLQEEASPGRLAEEALAFVEAPALLEVQRKELAGVRARLGDPGVADRVAQLVLKRLGVLSGGTRPPDQNITSSAPEFLVGVAKPAPNRVSLPGAAILPPWFQAAYGLGWGLLWPAAALYYGVRSRTDGKYADSGFQRLGLRTPGVKPGMNPIWIHALSVGETLSVLPLVRELRARFPEVGIVFSTATETGQNLARRSLDPWVDSFFYLPLDLPLVTGHLVRAMKPRFFILVETDLWPQLLTSLGCQGAPAFLVNGRLSGRSFQRMLPLRGLWGRMLSSFHTIFAQSELDREQYIRLGARPDRVRVAGNLKFDAAPEPLEPWEVTALRASIGLDGKRPVWIAGSTHEGEESVLLEAHGALVREFPDLLLVVAPRNPNRAAEIARLGSRFGFRASMRSSAGTAAENAVYILDTLGELGRFYAIADVAFVGGSWVPFGGHNPLEAAAQGKPACWGPHLHNFRELESALLETGSYERVGSKQDLIEFVRGCLASPARRREALHKAGVFLENHRGAALRILDVVVQSSERSCEGPSC